MDQIHEELSSKWGVEGFNNHEQKALQVRYIDNFFNDYLPLKKRLLEARDGTAGDNNKKFYNALRIYCYSLFENTWFGYLASYAQSQETRFSINNKNVSFGNAYRTHLPSFSSAILNFGTCRDLFFILLKLYANPSLVDNPRGIRDLLNTRYQGKDFDEDLSKISSDSDYLKNGQEFFSRNKLRNFFAHKVRILWWHNHECGSDYYIPRQVYDDIQINKSSNYIKHVESFFQDHKTYETSIESSACTDLISSREMLKEAHDTIAQFLNRSFELLKV